MQIFLYVKLAIGIFKYAILIWRRQVTFGEKCVNVVAVFFSNKHYSSYIIQKIQTGVHQLSFIITIYLMLLGSWPKTSEYSFFLN